MEFLRSLSHPPPARATPADFDVDPAIEHYDIVRAPANLFPELPRDAFFRELDSECGGRAASTVLVALRHAKRARALGAYTDAPLAAIVRLCRRWRNSQAVLAEFGFMRCNAAHDLSWPAGYTPRITPARIKALDERTRLGMEDWMLQRGRKKK